MAINDDQAKAVKTVEDYVMRYYRPAARRRAEYVARGFTHSRR
jgi:hypothetical protein